VLSTHLDHLFNGSGKVELLQVLDFLSNRNAIWLDVPHGKAPVNRNYGKPTARTCRNTAPFRLNHVKQAPEGRSTLEPRAKLAQRDPTTA
jgi:hypothetical protein